MLKTTDSKHPPWHEVHSDDKKRARLNCISHILSLIPYKKIRHEKVKLPKRSNKGKYDDRGPGLSDGLRGSKSLSPCGPIVSIVRPCFATKNPIQCLAVPQSKRTPIALLWVALDRKGSANGFDTVPEIS